MSTTLDPRDPNHGSALALAAGVLGGVIETQDRAGALTPAAVDLLDQVASLLANTARDTLSEQQVNEGQQHGWDLATFGDNEE